jgi:two-component system NtrC family sensor kinase
VTEGFRPLTGILTFSHQMMRKLKDHPELQQELELIVKEATRASAVVRGLLDFSRETQPQKRPCNINELVLHTLSLTEGQAAFRRIQIRKNLDLQAPWFSWMPTRFSRSSSTSF